VSRSSRRWWQAAVGLVVGLHLAGTPPVAGAAAPAAAPVLARAGAGTATLADGAVARTWRVTAAGAVTTSLRDPSTGREWALASSPDFSVTVAGQTYTSASGWDRVSAVAGPVLADPARPTNRDGEQITFRYVHDLAGSSTPQFVVERVYTLYPGSAVIGVTSTLRSLTSAALTVSDLTLDELSSPLGGVAHVYAYHGGASDQLDHRDLLAEPGAFDTEGQVVRYDDGSGSGFFEVSERRSGASSRAGRAAIPGGWRTWTGVEPGRENGILPLVEVTPGDTSNRLDNPGYPAGGRTRTLPGYATLDLGRAHLGVYAGGAAHAPAAFVADFAAHTMAAFPRAIEQNTFHPFPDGQDTNDAFMRNEADAARALGVELFMFDDGWQGGPDGLAGDWRLDPARFPDTNHDGTPDFVKHLDAIGMRFGLWVELALFNKASQAYQAHPDWACTPSGDAGSQVPDSNGFGFWDVTQPAVQDYLSGVVDRLVRDYHLAEIKLDNQTWLDCGSHDYNDYHDAWIALVRRLEQRHPDVTFQLDETVDQRSWGTESAALGPSWFEDDHLHDGAGEVPTLLHDIWSAAPWLPPSSVGLPLLHNVPAGFSVRALMPIAVLSHLTFWTDVAKLDPASADEVRWWLRWYTAHRGDLSGVVLPDTDADPGDGRSWTAFQPWSGDHGYLTVFRQQAADATHLIALQGVDRAATYQLHDVRDGADLGRFTGDELMAGLPVTLAAANTSRMISITPVDAPADPTGGPAPSFMAGALSLTATSRPASCAVPARRRLRASYVRHRGRPRLRLTGLLPAARCGATATRVAVSVSRRIGRSCVFITAHGRLSHPRRCGHPVLLHALGGSRRLRVRLRPGRYRVVARTVDPRGRPRSVTGVGWFRVPA